MPPRECQTARVGYNPRMTQLTLSEGFAPVSSAPCFGWPGGKERLLTEILPLMPVGLGEMVSPFVGGGAVEVAMAAAGTRVHASDAHPALVGLWQLLLDAPDDLADRLAGARGIDREAMLDRISLDGKDGKDAGAALFLRLLCTLYGCPTSKTLLLDWPTCLTVKKERELRGFRAPLLSVDLRDYRDALARRPRTFAYLDPPYVEEEGYAYKNLYGNAAHFDHEEFASAVRAHKAPWVLSINDCRWARETFGDCAIHNLRLKWTVGLREGKTAAKRGELLIHPRRGEQGW